MSLKLDIETILSLMIFALLAWGCSQLSEKNRKMEVQSGAIKAIIVDYNKWKAGYSKRLDMPPAQFVEWVLESKTELELEEHDVSTLFHNDERMNYVFTKNVLNPSSNFYSDSENDLIYIIFDPSLYFAVTQERFTDLTNGNFDSMVELLRKSNSKEKYIILQVDKKKLWFDYNEMTKTLSQFENEHNEEIEDWKRKRAQPK